MEEHNVLEVVALILQEPWSSLLWYASPHTSILRTHLKTHTGEKSYKCSHSNFVSSGTSVLNKHLKTHSDQENATSVNMPSLRQAIWGCFWIHSGKIKQMQLMVETFVHTHWRKSNKCRQCNFASYYSNTFNKHLKTYSGVYQINATDVNMPSLRQSIWGWIWWCKVE